jgi:release factor glutamine methyltransferase
MTTLSEDVARARRRLESAGIDSNEAALDARVLAQHLLGWDAARLLTRETEAAPAAFRARFDALIARRLAREPVAYILGEKEFWNLTFTVTPAVLVPRPETELLVEAALQLFPDRDARFYVADAGTGSGCIAVALAKERPHAVVFASDISAAALAVARQNAERHGVATRIEFAETDLLKDAPDPFDLIVSNPPYVPAGQAPSLQPEVRDYEPAVALFAGDDGLAAIRRLVGESVLRLSGRGFLVFEFGFGQAEAVEQLVGAAPGLRLLEIRKDLQGIPRVAISTRG